MKHYLVLRGRVTGVFNTWAECKASVDGYSGARYKAYSSNEEALQALEDESKRKEIVYNNEIQAIYCDGGIVGGSRSEVGYSWAWVAVSEPIGNIKFENEAEVGGLDSMAKIIKFNSGHQKGDSTNNLAEYIAAIEALESLPEGWSGRFLSDSQVTIGRLFYGWKSKLGLTPEIVQRGKDAVARLGHVVPIQLAGHPTDDQLKQGFNESGLPVSKWNVLCDELCNREKEKLENAMV